MSKKALGRGLDALLPPVSDGDSVTQLDVRDLRANPYQPRREFNEEKLMELSESIREHGIIQPIIVRKSAVRGYEIVAGERRFRAAQRVGMTTVPAVVREFSDVQLMEIALIENLQREDLNAIEVAEAYANLLQRCGWTQDELAQHVGQSRSHVANTLRLLQLPRAILEHVSRGTLSMGHARALLAVEHESEQVKLADRVVNEDLSVRRLEAIIYAPKQTVSRETLRKEPVVQRYEEQFRVALGTSVRIRHGKKRGRIEIDYFSHEDLERILTLIASDKEPGR